MQCSRRYPLRVLFSHTIPCYQVLLEIYNIQKIIAPKPELTSPCIPSPCGANAVCREQNGAGSCTCLPEYFGNPYESCRPECVVNTDCPSNKGCVRNKCVDVCPGVCGLNAECQVVSHVPLCTCWPSYTGDPFRVCSPIPTQPGIFSHHRRCHKKKTP